MAEPLFRKVDCLQVPVPDLEAGLAFYRDQLGHALIWRTATAAGLRMAESDAELVIQTERPLLEAEDEVGAGPKEASGARGVLAPLDEQIGQGAAPIRPVQAMHVPQRAELHHGLMLLLIVSVDHREGVSSPA